MRLKRISGPTNEPLNVEEAKNHLRVDQNAENNLIETTLKTARMRVELETKRALITQTWEMTLDSISGSVITIPKPPLQSVSKIEFVAEDGTKTEQSSDTYIVDSGGQDRGRIILKDGCTWLSHRGYSSVIITFVTGYGDNGDDIPVGLKTAILQFMTHLYENRGDESVDMPKQVRTLIMPYKIMEI